jgi:hypothetical protein
VSAGYPYRTRRSRPNRSAETEVEPEHQRSNAAIPVAIVVTAIGLYLGHYTILFPLLFGVFLLSSGTSFLSTRLNPLSPHFYLTRKPSWSAIGVVFLAATLLIYAAYAMWLHHYGPILPRL